MRLTIILVITFCSPMASFAQTLIYGTIRDVDGKSVPLANIYLKDNYDGTIADVSGNFSFQSQAKGNATLIVSAVGFKTLETSIKLDKDSIYIDVTLLSQAIKLSDVVITAGAFEASDKKRGVILRSLDIVTTAGGGGDIYGAIQTLPGVSPANNETGLFVRGGAAHEAKTIIDGMIVSNPFFGDVPDVPARGRFSPFGFSGMVFSTGGYSAEYGQALSSVLILNSNNQVENDIKSLNVSAAGASFAITKALGKKNSLYADIGYTNLKPLFGIVKQNREWLKAPTGFGATLAYVGKQNEMKSFRIQARYQHSKVALRFSDPENINASSIFRNSVDNFSSYSSYSRTLKNKWNVVGGISFQYDEQGKVLNNNAIPNKEIFFQARSVLSKRFSTKINLKTGVELQQHNYAVSFNQFQNSFKETYLGAFVETDNKISDRLLSKTGIRLESSFLNKQFKASPRFALAYKTGYKSQVSLAYGHYYQSPENQVYARNNKLKFEKAVHYIVNYQYLTPKYTFRVEGFYKDYQHLVTYSSINGNLQSSNNDGKGYAKGVDIFWRDNQSTIKNLDYWISYSFIKSERVFRNLNFMAIPNFAPAHTLNVVGKYELAKIRSRIGATYTLSSGKWFYNPVDFSKIRTDDFQNFSVSGSHITSILKRFTVIHASVNNVFNIKTIINYRFSADGTKVQEVVPSTYRSFFAGLSIRI